MTKAGSEFGDSDGLGSAGSEGCEGAGFGAGEVQENMSL